jgi:outer membrane receptor protein involved in Fe transport
VTVPIEVSVVGAVREARPASTFDVEVGVLSIVPRKTAMDHLMLAPGILTANHGGEGHANETFMRGFAAREGQDIEFLVDGVPINEVSNAHGHGYADVLFVPPEFVRRVIVTQGAFDPEQGDFAFAGTADYRLGALRPGATLTVGQGSFDTQRVLASYAPAASNESFGGVEYYRTDGFGANRAAQRGSALARIAGSLGGADAKYALTAFGYGARWDQPGVVRQDDYQDGEVGFFGSYDPNQGGDSDRVMVAGATEHAEGHFRQTTFWGHRGFRNRSNFTGFYLDQAHEAAGGGAQRGDGVEQRYGATTFGSRGVYSATTLVGEQPQLFAIGYAVRHDFGISEQFRLRAVTAVPYATVFAREFQVTNVAGFAKLNLRFTDWLAVRGGLRLDTFAFGVVDRNQPEVDREGPRIASQTSHALGLALSPRGTVEARLSRGLSALASYGRATRSTEAAALSDNEPAPFASAEILDFGFRLRSGTLRKTLLESQLSYAYTTVNRDLLFSEAEARNVLVGPSTRHAVLASTRVRAGAVWDTLLNVGYAYATLDETGERLPYVPELVMRGDTALQGSLFGWQLGGVPLVGHTGLGITYLPGRPLPYRDRSEPVLLTNLGAELRMYQFSLGLDIRNLFDMRYRQSEFNYPSNFAGPGAPLSRSPERHFVAGDPFFLMVSLTIHAEEWLMKAGAART